MRPTHRPSPRLRRVGVHDSLSGAASDFTRVTARRVTPLSKAHRQFLGPSIPRAGFHLLDDDAFTVPVNEYRRPFGRNLRLPFVSRVDRFAKAMPSCV